MTALRDYWSYRIERDAVWAYVDDYFDQRRRKPALALMSGYAQRWPSRNSRRRGDNTARVRFRVWYWNGTLPEVGDFFMSRRPTVAFEIVEIRPCKSAKFAVTCKRWNPADVPGECIVHEWRWGRP